jgi:hypothetical protein
MALVTTAPSSRRALLGAAIGGVAAFVAQGLARPLPVRAADGETVLVGGEYTSTSVTKISNTTTGDNVLEGESSSGTGVTGVSSAGIGVYGIGVYGIAVYGNSVAGVGVWGDSGSGPGVWGNSPSIGVVGVSGAPPVERPAKTGLYGYAVQDAGARGVSGESTAGHGVHGQATTGRGIHGEATTGTGVYAIATTGTALRAEGAVRFKTSGLATIAAGTRSVVVTPAGLDVTTSSKILALLQGDAGGSTTVQRVAVNATANTFTIYLTANAVRAVKVSWFVIS